jgi:hypothetical protein
VAAMSMWCSRCVETRSLPPAASIASRRRLAGQRARRTHRSARPLCILVQLTGLIKDGRVGWERGRPGCWRDSQRRPVAHTQEANHWDAGRGRDGRAPGTRAAWPATSTSRP